MLPNLILLFTIIPALEIYLLVKIGAGIGAANTVLIIIMTGVVGAYYVRLQGFAILSRLQNNLSEGRMPAGEIVDGAMLLVGGALLMTPGFITDISGFLLVFPPTRNFLKKIVVAWIKRKIDRGELTIRRF